MELLLVEMYVNILVSSQAVANQQDSTSCRCLAGLLLLSTIRSYVL